MTFGKESPPETYRTDLLKLQEDLRACQAELQGLVEHFPPSRERVAALLNKVAGAATVARFNLYTPDELKAEPGEPSYTLTSEE